MRAGGVGAKGREPTPERDPTPSGSSGRSQIDEEEEEEGPEEDGTVSCVSGQPSDPTQDEAYFGVWMDPTGLRGYDMTPTLLRERHDPDEWELNYTRGYLRVIHNQPRMTFFVPGGTGFPCPVEQLRPERKTRCEGINAGGAGFCCEWIDDWPSTLAFNPQLPMWKGTTWFALVGSDLPWENDVWPGTGRPSERREDGPPEGGDRRDGGGSAANPREDAEDESSTTRSRSRSRAGGGDAAALDYIEAVSGLGSGTPSDWNLVRGKGDQLLEESGSVQAAARALWSARKEVGLDNLRGVQDEGLQKVLHPDLLSYLREMETNGVPARFVGPRRRVEGSLHPMAKKNIDQVYKQIFKDVKKHRVLVVSKNHPMLGCSFSSPFEAVPKMLPDRSLSKDMRIVHDQRTVNGGTCKELHPPALQPTHRQIVRRVLFAQARFPGLPVLMSKKDVAGAFRLLWIDPADVELFAGDLPWRPDLMEVEETNVEDDAAQRPLTVIFLVSSFGFSGSPGEWSVFGRATEEWHRAHRPLNSRRDGACGFDAKILVDDCVLVEAEVGLRPWVSAEVYEEGVRKLLGKAAINAEKDELEGAFRVEQCVWGLTINTELNKAFLPERRILKGAHLLAHQNFDYGCKDVTLKQMQQFRGIMTGWAVVVPALKNELKAADVFLGKGEPNMRVRPKLKGYGDPEEEEQRSWEELWELFTSCRWLSSRTETWATKFGASLPELLEPRERLSLPGAWDGVVYVSSDATTQVIGAVDWTNLVAARASMKDLRPWLEQALQGEDGADNEEARIHLAEMLSSVAFACEVGARWTGKVVIYAGDNMVVRSWVEKRQSNSRAGRILEGAQPV